MITPDDLILIDCENDLIQAGIQYTIQRSANFQNEGSPVNLDILREKVAAAAVELAFRRLLTERDAPFASVEPAGFLPPDQYEIAIGGRRCQIVNQLVTQPSAVIKLHDRPASILEQPAPPPPRQRSTVSSDEDLYIFAFLTAGITRSQQDLQKSIRAGRPYYLFALMPPEWISPQRWNGLGELVFKADTAQDLSVTAAGLDRQRLLLTRQFQLAPLERQPASSEYYSLHYLHTDTLPDGPVGIHSPALGDTHLVAPYQWGNLWVSGQQIYLAGYCTVGELKRQTSQVPLARLLHPLGDLFDRARKWGEG